MRTRLAHTLSFWLLGAVALSVLAMGGLTAWNLRQGFGAYLQARDLERLDAFVALVADRLAQADASTADAAPPPDMRALLRELAMREGVPAAACREPRPDVPALMDRRADRRARKTASARAWRCSGRTAVPGPARRSTATCRA